MGLRKIKMPTCMQECKTLKMLFKMKAFESTTYPGHVSMTEDYIFCNKEDKEVVKQIIREFEKGCHENDKN